MRNMFDMRDMIDDLIETCLYVNERYRLMMSLIVLNMFVC